MMFPAKSMPCSPSPTDSKINWCWRCRPSNVSFVRTSSSSALRWVARMSPEVCMSARHSGRNGSLLVISPDLSEGLSITRLCSANNAIRRREPCPPLANESSRTIEFTQARAASEECSSFAPFSNSPFAKVVPHPIANRPEDSNSRIRRARFQRTRRPSRFLNVAELGANHSVERGVRGQVICRTEEGKVTLARIQACRHMQGCGSSPPRSEMTRMCGNLRSRRFSQWPHSLAPSLRGSSLSPPVDQILLGRFGLWFVRWRGLIAKPCYRALSQIAGGI